MSGYLGYCDGKKIYPTWSAAARAAKLMARSVPRTRDVHPHPYRCKLGCGKFHVGSGVGRGFDRRSP
jgi:hypothetical protein